MQESTISPMIQDEDSDFEKLIHELWCLKEKNFKFHSTTIFPTNTASSHFAIFKTANGEPHFAFSTNLEDLTPLLSQHYHEALSQISEEKEFDLDLFRFMIKTLSYATKNEQNQFKEIYMTTESCLRRIPSYLHIGAILLDKKENEQVFNELKQKTDTVSQLLISKIQTIDHLVRNKKNEFMKRLDLPQLLESFFNAIRTNGINIMPINLLSKILKKNLCIYSFDTQTSSYTSTSHTYSKSAETIYVLRDDKSFARLIPIKDFKIEPIWQKIQQANSMQDINKAELNNFVMPPSNQMELSDYSHLEKLPSEIIHLIATFLLPKNVNFINKKYFFAVNALSSVNKRFHTLIQKNPVLWREILFSLYQIKYGFFVKKNLQLSALQNKTLDDSYRTTCLGEISQIDNDKLQKLLQNEINSKIKDKSFILNPYLPLLIARNYFNNLADLKLLLKTNNFLGVGKKKSFLKNLELCIKFTLISINHGNNSAWFLLYGLDANVDLVNTLETFKSSKEGKNLIENFNEEILQYFTFNKSQLSEALHKKCSELLLQGLDEDSINKINEKLNTTLVKWSFSFSFYNFETVRKIFMAHLTHEEPFDIDTDMLRVMLASNNINSLLNCLDIKTIELLSKTSLGKEFLKYCLNNTTLSNENKKTLGTILFHLSSISKFNIALTDIIKLVVAENGDELLINANLPISKFADLLSNGDLSLIQTRIKLLSNPIFILLLKKNPSLTAIISRLSPYDMAMFLLELEPNKVTPTVLELGNIIEKLAPNKISELKDLKLISSDPNLIKNLNENPELLKRFSLKGICHLHSNTSLMNAESIKDIIGMLGNSSVNEKQELKLINYLSLIIQHPNIIELLKIFSNIQREKTPYNMLLDFLNKNHLQKLIDQHSLIDRLFDTEKELLSVQNDSELESQIRSQLPNNSTKNINKFILHIPALISTLISNPKILDAVRIFDLLTTYPFRYNFILTLKSDSFQFWDIKEIKSFLIGSKNALTNEVCDKLRFVPQLLASTHSYQELKEILESSQFDIIQNSLHCGTIFKYLSFEQILSTKKITINKIFWTFNKLGEKQIPTTHVIDILFTTGSERFWNELFKNFTSLTNLYELLEKNETIELLLSVPHYINTLLVEKFTFEELENLNRVTDSQSYSVLRLLTTLSFSLLKCILSFYSYADLVAITQEDIDVIKCSDMIATESWLGSLNSFKWKEYKEFFSQKNEHATTIAKQLLSSQYALKFIKELSRHIDDNEHSPIKIWNIIKNEPFLSDLLATNDCSIVYGKSSTRTIDDTIQFYRRVHSITLTSGGNLLQWMLTTKNLKAAQCIINVKKDFLYDKNYLEIITQSNQNNMMFECFNSKEINNLYTQTILYKNQQISILAILLAQGMEEQYPKFFKDWTPSQLRNYILDDLKSDSPRLPSVLQATNEVNINKSANQKRKRSYFFDNKEQNQSELEGTSTPQKQQKMN